MKIKTSGSWAVGHDIKATSENGGILGLFGKDKKPKGNSSAAAGFLNAEAMGDWEFAIEGEVEEFAELYRLTHEDTNFSWDLAKKMAKDFLHGCRILVTDFTEKGKKPMELLFNTLADLHVANEAASIRAKREIAKLREEDEKSKSKE